MTVVRVGYYLAARRERHGDHDLSRDSEIDWNSRSVTDPSPFDGTTAYIDENGDTRAKVQKVPSHD